MAAGTRKHLDRARLVRAGVIGVLACCTCCYPLVPYDTETRHAEDCQAHSMTLSARATGSQGGYLQLGFDAETPAEVLHG